MRTRLMSLLVLVALVVSVTGCAAQATPTKAAEKPYKEGDVIRIIIPFAAGGGYDRIARLIQPTFQAAIKEASGVGVTVIVENVEGAGGVLGYSQMFRAAPDGKTLGVVGLAGAPYQQLATGQFDLSKFVHIGQLNTDPTMACVGASSPIKTAKDLFDRSVQKTVLQGTSGQGSSEHVEGLILQALLKEAGTTFNLNYVHYTGSGPYLLGLVKGEVEFILSTESTSANLAKSGDIRCLFMFSPKQGVLQTTVPTAKAAGVPRGDEITQVLGMIRLLVAAPGTPDSAANILRTALQKTLTNADVLKNAATANLVIEWASAESVQNTVAARLAVANKYKDIVMPIYK